MPQLICIAWARLKETPEWKLESQKTTVFILLRSACEMKREEGSEGKKGQEGDGQCPAVLPCPNTEAVDSGPQAGHIQIMCQGIWDQETHMQFPPSGNARGAVSAIVEISYLGSGSSCQKITLHHDRNKFFFVEKVLSGCIRANRWSWGVAKAKCPFLTTIQSYQKENV